MQPFAAALFVLCALKGIEGVPRPDFAIDVTITGTSKISNALSRVTLAAELVGQYQTNLNSPYGLLSDAADALYGFAVPFVQTLGDLTVALDTLANSNAGPEEDAFDTVYSAIDAVASLITNDFPPALADLAELLFLFLPAELSESFTEVLYALQDLYEALEHLEHEIESFEQASGSAEIRDFVKTLTMYNVLIAVRRLYASIPVVSYTINHALQNLDTADVFILDLLENVDSAMIDLEAYVQTQFALEISNLAMAAFSYLDRVQEEFQEELEEVSELDPQLSSLPSYSDLGTMLSLYESNLVPTSLLSAANGAAGGYLDSVLGLVEGLGIFYGLTGCSVIVDVVRVLIDSGPFDEYCFYKYSPRVYNLFLDNTFLVEECYEREVDRLSRLIRLFREVTRMIEFDFDDLDENLSACANLSDTDYADNCVADLVDIYNSLADLVTAKYGLLAEAVDVELHASVLRINACMRAKAYLMVQSAAVISDEVNQCELSGYFFVPS